MKKSQNIRLIFNQIFQYIPKYNYQNIVKNVSYQKVQSKSTTQNAVSLVSKQTQFKFSTDLKAITELQELEKQFINIYNSDPLMLQANQGLPLIQNLIQSKEKIYKTVLYNGWVDDSIIQIEYLYQLENFDKARDLTQKCLVNLEEDTQENIIQKTKIFERLSIKVAATQGIDEGLQSIEKAIGIFQNLKESENSEYMAKLFKIQSSLYESNNQFEEAFMTYEKVGNIYNNLINTSKNDVEKKHFIQQQALTYKQFGKLCQTLQLYKEAETLYSASFNLWSQIEGENMESLDFIKTSKNLAELYIETGKFDKAFRHLTQCEKSLKFIDEVNASAVAQIYILIGKYHYQVQNYPQSIKYIQQAEDIMNRYSISTNIMGLILEQKILLQYFKQQYDDVLTTAKQGLQICEKYQCYDYFYLKYLYFQGLANQSLKNYQEALDIGKKLQEKGLEIYGEDSEHVADGLRVSAHAQLSIDNSQAEQCISDILKAAGIYGLMSHKLTDYMFCLEDVIRHAQQYKSYEKAKEACTELKVVRKEIMENMGVQKDKIDQELSIIDNKIEDLEGKIALQKIKAEKK